MGQNKNEIVAKGQMPLRDLKASNALAATNARYQYTFQLNTPLHEGPYRLFMYVSDEQQKAATGNTAFYVYNK